MAFASTGRMQATRHDAAASPRPRRRASRVTAARIAWKPYRRSPLREPGRCSGIPERTCARVGSPEPVRLHHLFGGQGRLTRRRSAYAQVRTTQSAFLRDIRRQTRWQLLPLSPKPSSSDRARRAQPPDTIIASSQAGRDLCRETQSHMYTRPPILRAWPSAQSRTASDQISDQKSVLCTIIRRDSPHAHKSPGQGDATRGSWARVGIQNDMTIRTTGTQT